MPLFDRRHNQAVARIVRDEHGLEMTPDEVDQARQDSFAAVRAALRAKGYRAPDDDAEFFVLIRQAMREDEPEVPAPGMPEPDVPDLDDLPELSEEDRRALDLIDIEAILRKGREDR